GDLVEEVAVASACLADTAFSGQSLGSGVSPSEGAGIEGLVGGKRCSHHRRLSESRPKAVGMGRYGHSAEGSDSLQGFWDPEVPGDDFADAVGKDVAGLRGNLDGRNDEEVGSRGHLRGRDASDRVVVADRYAGQACFLGTGHEKGRRDLRVR